MQIRSGLVHEQKGARFGLGPKQPWDGDAFGSQSRMRRGGRSMVWKSVQVVGSG